MPSNPNANVRAQAEQLLARLELCRAPVPVDRIAKSLGAVLRFSPLDEELSGMVYIKDGTPIIGVNSLHHPNRQRFTIAHEIGHLELHRSILTSQVHVDKEFQVMMRGTIAAEGTDARERAANEFAANLLVPQALLVEELAGKTFDIDDDKPLEDLAKKFRVSKKTMEYRIANLNE